MSWASSHRHYRVSRFAPNRWPTAVAERLVAFMRIGSNPGAGYNRAFSFATLAPCFVGGRPCVLFLDEAD